MSQDVPLQQSAFHWRPIAATPWVLALMVAVAYFAAARLGLVLQKHEVAVFWPAAGISAGTLIALGPRARLSVAAGVTVANFAANLLDNRNFWSTGVFTIADVAEAVLAAALIERWFGERFELDRLSHVLGLVAVAPAATAASGVVGTLGYVLFHPSATSPLSVWYEWFVSDALGVVAVAPLLIGFAAALRRPPKRAEIVEGMIALVSLAGVASLVIYDATAPWTLAVPLALSFPLLLWIGARCPPVFAGAASFVATMCINLTATFGIGVFGDPTLSVVERIRAAHAGTLAVALCAIVLAALFAERRRHETALSESVTRLQEGLALARVSTFAWDRRTGATQRSPNAAQMLGFDPEQGFTSTQFLAHVHPDDRARVRTTLRYISPHRPSYDITFRFIRPDGRLVWLNEVSKVEFDAAGRNVRVTGLTRDNTDRKRAEEILHDSEERLRLAIEAGQLAAWDRDDRIGTHFWSDEYYRIFGYRVGEVAPSRAAWLARVHPEDRATAEARVNEAEHGLRNYFNEFRIVRPDGTVRWVRARGRYLDVGGDRMRTIGLIEDITNDKQHAETQRVLVAELQHRTRNLMAVVESIAQQTLDAASSRVEFEERFGRRLQALSRVQSLLSRADSQLITIGALAQMELEAIGADAFGERIEIRGPEIPLRKSAVEMLSLAIHELATNAIKYGALANPTGRLSVTWRSEGLPRERQLVLEWMELAITPPSAPDGQRRGYGRTLIEEALPFSLGAETRFELGVDTLHCRISIPLVTNDTGEVAA